MADGVPEGYRSIQPFLMVPDIDAHMEFLKQGLDATIIERVAGPDGKVMHGEVRIGDCVVMLGSACSGTPSQSLLYLYVADADATHVAAVAAGATNKEAPADQFYGDRVGAITDPCGNTWWIATRKETLSEAELAERLGEGGA